MSHTTQPGGYAAAFAALALLATGAAAGHHGTAAYDRDRPITVAGTVREFRWTSPHAWILVDVPLAGHPSAGTAAQPAASEQWAFEGSAISVMVRNGWRSSTLHAGDQVRVLAAPRRDGKHAGEFIAVTLGDSGRTLQAGTP
jgi:hypothetical protein